MNRASRAVLLLAALGCCAFAVLRAPSWFELYRPLAAGSMVLVAVVCATAFAVIACMHGELLSRRVAIELVMLGAALLVAEAVITARTPAAWTKNQVAQDILTRERAADRLGGKFDGRTTTEVIDGLRAQGVNALPGIGRDWPSRAEVRAQRTDGFYPLSHASNSTVVQCNEGGSYLVYETDEFGFNNPRGLLAREVIDIAVIGESHALGHCVPPQDSLVARIREVYPRTANFAVAGMQPLGQLASLREYAAVLKPPTVLWFAHLGALSIKPELSDPTLARYLDPTFTQNLIHRQPEVDVLVRRLAAPLQASSDDALRLELDRATRERFRRVPLLPQVRMTFGPAGNAGRGTEDRTDTRAFLKILAMAKDEVSSWHGQLIVVVMPMYDEVVLHQQPESIRHARVAAEIEQLGIRVIDGGELFEKSADPATLFALRMESHPNIRGHELLADGVISELRSVNSKVLASTR